MTQTAAPLSFSIPQHRVLQAWAEPRPMGLRMEIGMEMDVADEVACLYRRGADEPAFYITPLTAGRVEVCAMPAGTGWEAGGVEEALASVEAAERDLDARR